MAATPPSSPPKKVQKLLTPPKPDPKAFEEIPIEVVQIWSFPTSPPDAISPFMKGRMIELFKADFPFKLLPDDENRPRAHRIACGTDLNSRGVFIIIPVEDNIRRLPTTNITPFRFRSVIREWGPRTDEAVWDKLVLDMAKGFKKVKESVSIQDRALLLEEMLNDKARDSDLSKITESMAKSLVLNSVTSFYYRWFVEYDAEAGHRDVWKDILFEKILRGRDEIEHPSNVSISDPNLMFKIHNEEMKTNGWGLFVIPLSTQQHRMVIVLLKRMCETTFDGVLLYNPHSDSRPNRNSESRKLVKTAVDLLIALYGRTGPRSIRAIFVSGSQEDEGHCVAASASFMKDLLRVFAFHRRQSRRPFLDLVLSSEHPIKIKSGDHLIGEFSNLELVEEYNKILDFERAK